MRERPLVVREREWQVSGGQEREEGDVSDGQGEEVWGLRVGVVLGGQGEEEEVWRREGSLVVRERRDKSVVVRERRDRSVMFIHLVHEAVVGHLWVLVGGCVCVQEPWGRTAVYWMHRLSPS